MSRWVWALVFGTTGVALVLASALLDPKEYQLARSVCLDLGLVLVAVPLVERLWALSGGNPLDLEVGQLRHQVQRLATTVDAMVNIEAIGLDRVYDCQANFGRQAEWLTLLQGAGHSVDIMGRTLFGWSRSAEVRDLCIRKVVHEDVQFRWLLMHEDNRYLPLLMEEDINIGEMLKEKLAAMRRFLTAIRDQLPEAKRHLFQVRYFDHVPLYCSIVAIDDRCFVNQYLFSASSDNSPFYCVRGSRGAWPKLYAHEFNSVWNLSVNPFANSPPALGEGVDGESEAAGLP